MPCFWTTKVPWFQEMRADLILSVEELSAADVQCLLDELTAE